MSNTENNVVVDNESIWDNVGREARYGMAVLGIAMILVALLITLFALVVQ